MLAEDEELLFAADDAVSPEGLRAAAADFREMSGVASATHALCARFLLRELGAPARKAIAAQVGVADCVARRFRQWAEQLELAAIELEEP
jgi:hypothetical protein